MKIGYPCINRSLDCRSNRRFILASYATDRLKTTVAGNLDCLQRMLEYNVRHNIRFLRIGSELVPFASHPVCRFNWQKYFRRQFAELGGYIRKHDIRISMHPDQFTLLNAQKNEIVRRSVAELEYHAAVLDLMELDCPAKVQIHVGGVYGDKPGSITRFIRNFRKLPRGIQNRLVIENDDTSYTVADCLTISAGTGIPVLFDNFHHRLNGDGEATGSVLKKVSRTWKKIDGIPLTDYSDQMPGAIAGKHAESIRITDFKCYLRETAPIDIDIMLEIKDKERSAARAVAAAAGDRRLVR